VKRRERRAGGWEQSELGRVWRWVMGDWGALGGVGESCGGVDGGAMAGRRTREGGMKRRRLLRVSSACTALRTTSTFVAALQRLTRRQVTPQ
jgi:hypothetical protein